MTIHVDLEIERTFCVRASAARSFDVLADVPYSVSHFPEVESLEDEGDGVYVWTLEEKGIAGIHHRVVYACRYVHDARDRTVTWTPVDGVGNSVVSGDWRIDADGQGSHIRFFTRARLTLDVSRLLGLVAEPFARQTFEAQVDQYLRNLQLTLNE